MNYKEIILESNLPALKLELDYPKNEMYEELRSLKKKSVSQIGNDEWKGCTLRGLSADKPRPFYEYGYSKEEDVPYKWTEFSKFCPITLNFIKQYFSDEELYRIKLNILKPQGKIHLHTDSITSGLGISDKSSDKETTYIALGIFWPKDVIFNIGEFRIPFKTGDAYLIDFSVLHEVYNPTIYDRYYLVITGNFHNNNKWRKIVLNSYEKNRKNSLPLKVDF